MELNKSHQLHTAQLLIVWLRELYKLSRMHYEKQTQKMSLLPWQDSIPLLYNRTTPHSTTGITPAEMLMGRTLRTHLDQIKPDVAAKIQSAQEAQK